MFGQWGQGYADPAQQLYWQQYYAQAQQYYGAYGTPVPGMPAASNAATTGNNPVPPEPPKEDRPPLPVEPPPDEEVHSFEFLIFFCSC